MAKEASLTDKEWLAMVSVFDVGRHPFTNGLVTIERCEQMEGPAKWAVRMREYVLTKGGEWITEPLLSNRTAGFFRRTRFDTKEAAYAAWRKFVAKAGRLCSEGRLQAKPTATFPVTESGNAENAYSRTELGY